ncbi:MAG: hypothetical protein WBN02_12130 [Sedimenticolaceae bacterium]
MLLTRLLNDCHRFPGFVYHAARLSTATKTIEIEVRPRKGSKARCSCCQRPAPGYDQLSARRFEFIPIWGYAVMLVYAMRRVQCRVLRLREHDCQDGGRESEDHCGGRVVHNPAWP